MTSKSNNELVEDGELAVLDYIFSRTGIRVPVLELVRTYTGAERSELLEAAGLFLDRGVAVPSIRRRLYALFDDKPEVHRESLIRWLALEATLDGRSLLRQLLLIGARHDMSDEVLEVLLSEPAELTATEIIGLLGIRDGGLIRRRLRRYYEAMTLSLSCLTCLPHTSITFYDKLVTRTLDGSVDSTRFNAKQCRSVYESQVPRRRRAEAIPRLAICYATVVERESLVVSEATLLRELVRVADRHRLTLAGDAKSSVILLTKLPCVLVATDVDDGHRSDPGVVKMLMLSDLGRESREIVVSLAPSTHVTVEPYLDLSYRVRL